MSCPLTTNYESSEKAREGVQSDNPYKEPYGGAQRARGKALCTIAPVPGYCERQGVPQAALLLGASPTWRGGAAQGVQRVSQPAEGAVVTRRSGAFGHLWLSRPSQRASLRLTVPPYVPL